MLYNSTENIEIKHNIYLSLFEFSQALEEGLKDGWKLSDNFPSAMVGYSFGLWLVKDKESEIEKESPKQVGRPKSK